MNFAFTPEQEQLREAVRRLCERFGHDYWLRFAELVIDLYDFTAADRMLCCLQFFYNDPPWQLLVALRAGTALVVMRRFSVSRYWPVVREHDVTVLFGIAATVDSQHNQIIYFNDDNNNAVMQLGPVTMGTAPGGYSVSP